MSTNTRTVCIPRRHFSTIQEDLVKQAGYKLTMGSRVWFDEKNYGGDELVALARDADAMLVSPWERIDDRVLGECGNLQVVVCAVIGVDKIDQAAANERGVLVCGSPAPENFIGLAEATVGLIVALAKGLKRNETELRGGGWYKVSNRGWLMRGRTVGLVGLGRVAQETAKRLGGWGMKLVGYDPYVTAEQAREYGVEKVELGALLKAADVVSVHVVLTGETRNLIGMRELRRMKREAVLVNTARGGVVNEAELAAALNEGVIAGAALDVFGNEPLEAESALRAVDPARLILTPHIIGHDRNVEEPGFKLAVETIRTALNGEAPWTVVNRAAIERWRTRFWS